MISATKDTLVSMLQTLRRRLSNGLMSGILYFRFKHRSATKQGHMCNFIVGDTVEREVFIVNLQTKEIVSSPEQLEEAADYCDDVFFLPSPHTHSELESFAAASAGLQLKAES